MCVLAFAWKSHPHWHLVAVANRDELHSRAAAPLDRWAGKPGILAGRDEVSGGTWLGVTPSHARFCAVTNVPVTERSSDAPSRGSLVDSVLTAPDPAAQLAQLELSSFNGFNLATITQAEASIWTNVPEPTKRRLGPGIYGLSNGRLGRRWPKVAMLEAELAGWMESDGCPSDLLDLLTSPAPFDPLPEEPRSGTPIFIRNAVYGTRCSTVVAVSASGAGSITERRFDEQGEVTGETCLSFTWALST